MGVDVVPVSIDINVPAIFEQRNRGDYIRALCCRGTSSIGLAKSEAVHARGGAVLRLDIYEFEASATRERGYVHRVSIVDADFDRVLGLRFFRETVTEYAKLVIADGDIDGRDRVRVYGFEL